MPPPSALSEEERFWSMVRKTDGCWEWTGALRPNGYGAFRLSRQRRTVRAHRYAWSLANGPIPPGDGFHGTVVCHRCDNKRCVRPDHLFIGAQVDNVRDMHAKGRRSYRVRRNEEAGNARLSAEQVREIRSAYAIGDTTYERLGKAYGVSSTAVGAIVRRRSWSTLPETG